MTRRSDGFFRELVRVAEEQGWHVESTKNSHVKFVSPSGATYYTASTPSDKRGALNLRAGLRRLGLRI